MSVTRSGKAALLAVALAATTVFGVAAPARAAGAGTLPAECPFTNTLCLFDGAGYSGARLTLRSLVPSGTCVSLVDHGWGGQARSALNTGSSAAALFANDGCLGGPFLVPAGGGVPDFGGFRPDSAWVR
ncbi:peptidase inhibitor family I36 protein [Rhizomonospora bruguierae]|uniref:peptidase inhibitor family I36 protein n=1 Tax=Rhizomonospora bruguierae TaxID=1581705 RepID=UPI001BCCACB9|nr:peptidase inhibitor family I36 protein [Micromonospora sp. NBRC 107566]